jgi:hypothetical protein
MRSRPELKDHHCSHDRCTQIETYLYLYRSMYRTMKNTHIINKVIWTRIYMHCTHSSPRYKQKPVWRFFFSFFFLRYFDLPNDLGTRSTEAACTFEQNWSLNILAQKSELAPYLSSVWTEKWSEQRRRSSSIGKKIQLSVKILTSYRWTINLFFSNYL